jgi:hypothetical protein
MRTQFLAAIFSVLAFSVFGQSVEYESLQRLNDSTFVVVKTTDTDEAPTISADQALILLFRLRDNYARLENKKLNEAFLIDRIGDALNRDILNLFPDTTYLDYNAWRDTVYTNPSNTGAYESILRIGADTTLNLEFFRTVGGNSVVRIQGDGTNTNYSARFIESDLVLRLGNNAKPLPYFASPIELFYLKTDNEANFKNYFYMDTAGRRIKLRLKVRDNE